MNTDEDEPETVDVTIDGSPSAPVVVQIDARRIAAIIFAACHTTEARSARAANAILAYLIQVHQDGAKLS
jgi:hypothetical protein